MNWNEKCLLTFDEENLFEDSMHRTRFKELLDCYSNYPFFTKGLCKCMYLSAWDDEHFCILLQMLSEMTLEHDTDTSEMRSNGDVLAQAEQGEEAYIYELSNAFLDNREFHIENIEELSPEISYIIGRALLASSIIDSI